MARSVIVVISKNLRLAWLRTTPGTQRSRDQRKVLRNSPVQQRNREDIFKLRVRVAELNKIDLANRRSPVKIRNVDVHFQCTR